MDGGAIHQNIQAAIAAVEVGGDLLGAGWVGDIQPPGQQMPVAGEGGGGLLGLGELAGGEHDGVAAQGELPGELTAMPRLAPVTSTTRVIARQGRGALLVICGPPGSERSTQGRLRSGAAPRSLTGCGRVL